MTPKSDIIAVLPAAGKASRLGPLPCSKEILPLQPDGIGSYSPSPGSRVVIEDALHMLGENGIHDAIVVTAPGKEDIADYLGAGPVGGVRVSYRVRANSPSVPHTLLTACEDLQDEDILIWFPDILVSPRDAVSQLAATHAASAADVTLALVPSDRGDKVDIVECEESGRVLAIYPKPGAGVSGWTWIAGLWSAKFTAYLRRTVATLQPGAEREMHVGDIINAACEAHFIIQSVNFPTGKALDIGTPEDLALLWAEPSRR